MKGGDFMVRKISIIFLLFAVLLTTVNVFSQQVLYCGAVCDTEFGQIFCAGEGGCFGGTGYYCDRGCSGGIGWVECTYRNQYKNIPYFEWCSAHCDVHLE